MNLKLKVKQSSEQVHCDIQGEKAILHTETGIYYTLNEVGSFIWDLIQEEKTLEDLIDKITSEFDVEKETAAQDLKELIADLEKEGLVACVSPN